MTLGEFAEKYRLRLVSERKALQTALHPDGNPHPDSEHVPGRRGWITEAGSAFNAFVITSKVSSTMKEATGIGMEVSCHGDRELGLYFDPENQEQAQLAIQIVKARRKAQRAVTPQMLENLKKARETRRMPFAA